MVHKSLPTYFIRCKKYLFIHLIHGLSNFILLGYFYEKLATFKTGRLNMRLLLSGKLQERVVQAHQLKSFEHTLLKMTHSLFMFQLSSVPVAQ